MAKSCPSRPPSGRLASSACATSNHCYKRNIHYLAADSDSTSKRRRRSTDTVTPALRSSPRKERGDTRLLFRDTKVAIFQAMFKYETEGGDSPVGRLVKEFGVHRNTPRKILNKVIKMGTLDNTWYVRGRPAEFGEDVWDAMVEIVREYRERKTQHAPARTICSELIARFDEETVPSIRTIQRKKAAKQ